MSWTRGNPLSHAMRRQRISISIISAPIAAILAGWVAIAVAPNPLANQVPNESCRYDSWSPPRIVPLPSVDSGLMLRDLQFAINGPDRTLLGVTTTVDSVARRVSRELVVVGEGSVPPLNGDFYFIGPRAVFTEDGALHVVWGEPGTPPTNEVELGVSAIRSLWHTSIHPGGKWDRPERILEGLRLSWRVGGQLFVMDGRVSVFIPVYSTTAAYTGGYQKRPGGWSEVSRLPHSGYLSVSTGVERPTRIAYVSGSHTTGANTLFVGSANDSLRSDAVAVAWSGDGLLISRVALLTSPDSTRLVWSLSEGPGNIREIRVASRRGASWIRGQALRFDRPVLDYRVVIDQCGKLHLAYQPWGDDGVPVLRYRQWDGQWSPPVAIEGDSLDLFDIALDPAISVGEDGVLVLSWSSILMTTPELGVPITLISELRQRERSQHVPHADSTAGRSDSDVHP